MAAEALFFLYCIPIIYQKPESFISFSPKGVKNNLKKYKNTDKRTIILRRLLEKTEK
jgi:hypothetical protein